MTPPRLLLIDGHSVAYRAFFALPVEKFVTATGQHTNAVFGFVSMLLNLLREEQPTHLAVAFDVSRHSFRTESYAEYKANRSASPEEFKGQVTLIKEVLDALNIVHVESPGFEADDVLATLVTRASADGAQVMVCTGDRDALQLVTDQVTVLYPRKGVSDLVRMTPAAVQEKYQVSPARYPELAALVGETSDNLPGVPGVGPKTAAKWIEAFDGLANIIDQVDQVPGKAGESLRAHLDDVKRNRSLNALVRDLELEVSIDDLKRVTWDTEAVAELFDALEFKVLWNRLQEMSPQDSQPSTGGFSVNPEVLGIGELKDWLTTSQEPIGVDFVGTWGRGGGDLKGLALARQDGKAIWIDATGLDPDDERVLADWLADPAARKVTCEVKGATLACTDRGWALAGVHCDVTLAAYLLKPDQRTFNLADLAMQYLHRELRAQSGETQDQPDQAVLDFGDEPDSGEMVADAMLRARALVDLGEVLGNELASKKQTSLLADLELPLAGVLARMEHLGIAVDLDRLNGLRAEFDNAVRAAEQAAFTAIDGRVVNLGSPKQLQGVLFDDLGMPKTKRTKSGYTTDAESLEKLFAQTGHPFLAHLLAHRDAIKLRQTVDGLLGAVQDDGRIHTTYMQTVAATGRLSSTDPNLQNIPIRTAEGRRIREAFVVGEGFETLLTADYSQIEMRLMADASGDTGLIEAFRVGRDFHSTMASKVFGVAESEVTPEQRARIKAMNYGLAYGLTSFGLSQQLNITRSAASALMDDYFENFGGVRDYLQQVVERARVQGYTETLLGRRRYLPDLNSANRQRLEMAERAALNAPIQGSAADVIKVAMLDLDLALSANGLRSRMLLQVHDELILEVAPTELDQVREIVRDKMGHALELGVPLEVSIGVGKSWHEAAH